MECRSISSVSVDGRKIVGRPIIYGAQSENLGGFTEVIATGAFKESVSGDIRALVEHIPHLLLGRTQSGTLRIAEDNTGITIEIDPPDTQAARDLMVSIQRGDISGMSFGFTVPAGGDSWDYTKALALRTVNKAVLHEITITSNPAYRNTEVALRNLQNNQHWLSAFRQYLALQEVL